MPYTIRQISPLCFSVINTQTGEVKSKCSTLEDAEKQRRLLYALETGWSPSLSYTDFLTRGMRNRPQGQSPQEAMRSIGQRWREIKK